jgi:ribosome maturation factor RimP
MPKDEARIEEIVRNTVERLGYELVDMNIEHQGRDNLNVFVYHPDGVSLDACQKISRELSDTLDAADIMPDKYFLIVSSPGLDRPLRTKRDFERNQGETIKFLLIDGKKVDGEILSVRSDDGGDFVIIKNKNEIFELAISKIKKGLIQVEI